MGGQEAEDRPQSGLIQCCTGGRQRGLVEVLKEGREGLLEIQAQHGDYPHRPIDCLHTVAPQPPHSHLNNLLPIVPDILIEPLILHKHFYDVHFAADAFVFPFGPIYNNIEMRMHKQPHFLLHDPILHIPPILIDIPLIIVPQQLLEITGMFQRPLPDIILPILQ